MTCGSAQSSVSYRRNPQSTDLAEQAKRYAGEGFDSLWVAHAVGRGFMLPDPFTALASAATATQEVELGTAVLQLPLYQPTDLAHRIFSLMQICGDRLTLGLGAGSTETDFIAFERSYADRFKTFDTSLAQLKRLLVEGKNEHCDLTPWENGQWRSTPHFRQLGRRGGAGRKRL